jgi:hypothetical protein
MVVLMMEPDGRPKREWNLLILAASIVFLIFYAVKVNKHGLVITAASVEVAIALWNFSASLFLTGYCRHTQHRDAGMSLRAENRAVLPLALNSCADTDGCTDCTRVGAVTLNLSFLFWAVFLLSRLSILSFVLAFVFIAIWFYDVVINAAVQDRTGFCDFADDKNCMVILNSMFKALCLAGSINFLIAYAIKEHGHWLAITLAGITIALALWGYFSSLCFCSCCKARDTCCHADYNENKVYGVVGMIFLDLSLLTWALHLFTSGWGLGIIVGSAFIIDVFLNLLIDANRQTLDDIYLEDSERSIVTILGIYIWRTGRSIVTVFGTCMFSRAKPVWNFLVLAASIVFLILYAVEVGSRHRGGIPRDSVSWLVITAASVEIAIALWNFSASLFLCGCCKDADRAGCTDCTRAGAVTLNLSFLLWAVFLHLASVRLDHHQNLNVLVFVSIAIWIVDVFANIAVQAETSFCNFADDKNCMVILNSMFKVVCFAGSIIFLIRYAIKEHGHWLVIILASITIVLALQGFWSAMGLCSCWKVRDTFDLAMIYLGMILLDLSLLAWAVHLFTSDWSLGPTVGSAFIVFFVIDLFLNLLINTQICSAISAALGARTNRIEQGNLVTATSFSDLENELGRGTTPNELLASGFRALAQIVNEDPVAFVERPNVKAFLARTGARSTEEVIECGLAKEFFDTFDTFGIPRERAQEHLGLEKADGTKESTALGAPASAIPGTTVYGTPMR